jgi:tetratricopeptide (TPR) repeat protein
MKNVFRLALVAAFAGAAGLVGCQATPSYSAGAPEGIDHYVQAVKQYHAGDEAHAMAQLIEATRQNANLIMPRIMLGDLYRDQGNYSNAVDVYQEVTKLDPYYASNWYKLGVGYQFMQKLGKAAASYEKALHLSPKSARSNMNLGLVELSLGHNDKALAYAKKATELEPKSAAAWSNLGVTLDALGQYSEAEEAYRKSIDLDPDNPATLSNLAANLTAQDKTAQATELLKRAANLSKTPEMYKRYGDALVEAKDFDQAIEQYELALKSNPNFYPAMTAMGFARIAQYRKGFELDEGKRADALSNWKKSLTIHPEQPKVQEAVRQWEHVGPRLLSE